MRETPTPDPPTERTTPRWLTATAMTLVLIVVLAAFALSFTVLRDLAALSGIPGDVAWLWPVIVDGTIAAATLVFYTSRGKGRRQAMVTLILFGVASIVGNVSHILLVDPTSLIPVAIAVFVGVMPPVGLIMTVELLGSLLRSRPSTTAAGSDVRHVADSASSLTAVELAAGDDNRVRGEQSTAPMVDGDAALTDAPGTVSRPVESVTDWASVSQSPAPEQVLVDGSAESLTEARHLTDAPFTATAEEFRGAVDEDRIEHETTAAAVLPVEAEARHHQETAALGENVPSNVTEASTADLTDWVDAGLTVDESPADEPVVTDVTGESTTDLTDRGEAPVTSVTRSSVDSEDQRDASEDVNELEVTAPSLRAIESVPTDKAEQVNWIITRARTRKDVSKRTLLSIFEEAGQPSSDSTMQRRLREAREQDPAAFEEVAS